MEKKEIMLDYMLTFDLGKGGAYSSWQKHPDDDMFDLYAIRGWDLGDYGLISKGLHVIVSEIYTYISDRRPIIVVEKPGRQLPYQWILFKDLKMIAGNFKIPYYEYHPMTIKKMVTGSGKADKAEILSKIQEIIHIPDGYEIKTEHECDSVATGICHLKSIGIMQ